MSTLNVNRTQFGKSATATQNFTMTAENADGTMKLARGVAGATTQDILTVDATGQMSASLNPATGLRSTALATMQKFADEFGSLQSANGYQKLPSGLIIQWGSGLFGNATVGTFPIAFPNNALQVIIGAQNFDNGQAVYNKVAAMSAYSLTKTGFTASSSTANAANATWIAIGY